MLDEACGSEEPKWDATLEDILVFSGIPTSRLPGRLGLQGGGPR